SSKFVLEYKLSQERTEENKVMLSKKNLPEIFADVKKQVDEFLGIDCPESPKFYFGLQNKGQSIRDKLLNGVFLSCGLIQISSVFLYENMSEVPPQNLFFGVGFVSMYLLNKIFNNKSDLLAFYSYSKKEIFTKEQEILDSKLTLVHEYTHFLQHIKLGKKLGRIKHSFCEEGHANGLANKLAKIFSENENKDYLSKVYSEEQHNFLKTYSWICNKLNIRKKFESNVELSKPNKYDLGTAYFYINEKLHGDGIYRSFLEESPDENDFYMDFLRGYFHNFK
ncbi:MAG: hypothetical protein L6266_03495, partial [Nanoarchaeota archaeon]|nr:hypothetical protein [Nanoarchaeota archaeon]